MFAQALLVLASLAMPGLAQRGRQQPKPSQLTQTDYLTLPGGESVFYRTSGPGSPQAPTVLLLHGFPSSSHQYRKLIPLLADRYNVIAPDLPGFGFTTVPDSYSYTFSNLTETVRSFLATLPESPRKYAMYIFDYGAPVGLRLALSDPEAVTAIVSQSGNAYDEGLGAFWDPFRKYWESESQEDRDALRVLLTAETTLSQYVTGTRNVEAIAPESYTLDQALLDRPGNDEIQLDLFLDYRTNVELYPRFHEYFRESQVPLLAPWGENDPIFAFAGAEAFKRDLPNAEVVELDAGHFAVETETETIAELVRRFLQRNRV